MKIAAKLSIFSTVILFLATLCVGGVSILTLKSELDHAAIEQQAQSLRTAALGMKMHYPNLTGFVTSGGYAHYSQKSVAYGFVPTALANEGLKVEIEILGQKRKATLYTETLFDPNNERLTN